MILYAALGGSVQAATCSHRLLVSAFFSTVHVYDACSGAYIKDLDSGSRLAGAQAIRVGPDGNLYVPGFGSHNMVRYDPRTGLTTQVVAPRQAGILAPRADWWWPPMARRCC